MIANDAIDALITQMKHSVAAHQIQAPVHKCPLAQEGFEIGLGFRFVLSPISVNHCSQVRAH
jgi:hypothetical protein